MSVFTCRASGSWREKMIVVGEDLDKEPEYYGQRVKDRESMVRESRTVKN